MTAGPGEQTLLHGFLDLCLAQVNKALETDPFTEAALRRLAGDRGRNMLLRVDTAETDLLLRLQATGPLLRLLPQSGRSEQPSEQPSDQSEQSGEKDSADVSLQGSLPAFVALALAEEKSAALAAGDVRITGDIRLVQQLGELADSFEPDAGALLAPWLGNPLAGLAQSLLGELRDTARASEPELRSRTTEALTERLQLLPSRAEFKDFSDELFNLQSKVERLSVHLDRLQT